MGPTTQVGLARLMVLGDPVVLEARRDLVALAVLRDLEGKAARTIHVVAAVLIAAGADGKPSRRPILVRD